MGQHKLHCCVCGRDIKSHNCAGQRIDRPVTKIPQAIHRKRKNDLVRRLIENESASGECGDLYDVLSGKHVDKRCKSCPVELYVLLHISLLQSSKESEREIHLRDSSADSYVRKQNNGKGGDRYGKSNFRCR